MQLTKWAGKVPFLLLLKCSMVWMVQSIMPTTFLLKRKSIVRHEEEQEQQPLKVI